MTFTDRWNQRMLEVAKLIASWSKDPSNKVGCLVVDADRNLLSSGYNGFARGVADDLRLLDRPTKYKMIIHAEGNAISTGARNGHSLKGGILFSTSFPCSSCAAQIIQVGIKEVIFLTNTSYEDRWIEDIRLASQMFLEVGIITVRYDPDQGRA